jgi:hypothetical protein
MGGPLHPGLHPFLTPSVIDLLSCSFRPGGLGDIVVTKLNSAARAHLMGGGVPLPGFETEVVAANRAQSGLIHRDHGALLTVDSSI